MEFQRLCGQLIADPERNAAICRDVVDGVRDGRSPLVLTERVDHLDDLAGRLTDAGLDVVILRGGMGRKTLSSELARIAADRPQVLLATGRFVGEGFDKAHLDTLFLTMPVSWRGTVTQYVGRLHRLHEGKREVRVYDYVDLDAPMLARMFDRRCRAYETQEYAVERPASAVPGWPAEVELPVQDTWKQRFQSGVSRLARDGVDAHAARLFLELVDEVTTNGADAARVRSASEAFLLQRLQDNPATRDRFRTNARLPIPFCQRGRHGSGLPGCRCAHRDRVGRAAASRGSRRVPARPAQGRIAAGERLPRAAVPCGGPRHALGRRVRSGRADIGPQGRVVVVAASDVIVVHGIDTGRLAPHTRRAIDGSRILGTQTAKPC